MADLDPYGLRFVAKAVRDGMNPPGVPAFLIEALREPTEEMRRVVAVDWGRRTWHQFQAVIDAAPPSQK